MVPEQQVSVPALSGLVAQSNLLCQVLLTTPATSSAVAGCSIQAPVRARRRLPTFIASSNPISSQFSMSYNVVCSEILLDLTNMLYSLLDRDYWVE